MKPQNRTFADVTAKFVGKPYSEYGKGPDSYGCLGLVYAFQKELGKPINETDWCYDGLSTDNFMQAWRKDPAKLEQIMISAFEHIGVEISVHEKLAGDMVIIQSVTGGTFFPGIYVGNNHIMASYADLGVRVFHVENKILRIVRVRRL
jgi:cell wall-associated NlpC family hydrolase